MHFSKFVLIALLLLLFRAAWAAADTYTVINTETGGAGSLYRAILDANARIGLDTITFNIPGTGVHTIRPYGALPALTDPVRINGTTQPGYAGTPLIQINGIQAGNTSGFTIAVSGCTIRALAINRFDQHGIHIQADADGNTITGNFIGTDTTGTTALPNDGSGIYIVNSATNTIGGATVNERNIIAGNQQAGILITGSQATGNTLLGNYIGVNAAGAAALGNGWDGILIDGAPNNSIGQASAEGRNIISGNAQAGVRITGIQASGNTLLGNYIGLNSVGAAALGNSWDGILIDGAPNNTIGGASAEGRNIISGNSYSGVTITNNGATGNMLQANFIGLNAAGTAAVGNQGSGVSIYTARGNYVGGTVAGATNVISGNGECGVLISGLGSDSNSIQRSIIGLSNAGTVAVPNATFGIRISDGSYNVIGGFWCSCRRCR